MEPQVLKTKYTDIYYSGDDDLRKLYSRVDYGPKTLPFQLFGGHDAEQVQAAVSKKVDALFRRVQTMLDMGFRKIDRVNIRLAQNQDQLAEFYKNLYGGDLNIRAWYSYQKNSIFVNLQDMNEDILAHEMGHAVSDQYFGRKLPRKTGEALARYVDKYLKSNRY